MPDSVGSMDHLAAPRAPDANPDTAAVEALVGVEVTFVGTLFHSKAGPLLHNAAVNGLKSDVIRIKFPDTPDRHAREETWASANHGEKVRVRGTLISYRKNRRVGDDGLGIQSIGCEYLGYVQVHDVIRDVSTLQQGGHFDGTRLESLVDSSVVFEATVRYGNKGSYFWGEKINGISAGNVGVALTDVEINDAWAKAHDGQAIRARGVLKRYGYHVPTRAVQSRGEGYYGYVTVNPTDIEFVAAGESK